jgi:hypothetical protein
MFAAKDWRKVDRLVDPVVPPRSVINASKLVCSAVSAVLAVLLVAVAPVAVAVAAVVAAEDSVLEAPAIAVIKLCTSAAKPGGGPPGGGPDGAVGALVADVAAPLSSSESALDDCDLRAVIRLFKKVCNACPTSVDVPVVDAVVALSLLAAAVLEVEVTPDDASAPRMAATSPPPGGAGGAELVTDDSSLVLLWFSLASSAVNTERELVELETELTLIACS